MKLRYEFYKRVSRGRTITIKPIQKCNLKCPYCSMDLGNPNWRITDKLLTPEQWMQIIKKENPSIVNISGGEPMLYPDLPELVKRIVSSGRLVSVVTNLSMIRQIEPSWRIVIYATYHKNFGKYRFTRNYDYYKKRGHQIVVWEFEPKILDFSRVKQLQKKPIFKNEVVYGDNGKRYNNCYLME